MATKTYVISASRAATKSTIVTDAGTGKTYVISDVGSFIAAAAAVVTNFFFHPFV